MIKSKIAVTMKLFTHCLLLASVSVLFSCNNGDDHSGATPVAAKSADTLTEEQKPLPENALHQLQVAEGLEVRALATEPLLKNPTNIDVDERGRVWVTEAYNYRP